jgi:hypothetical protein
MIGTKLEICRASHLSNTPPTSKFLPRQTNGRLRPFISVLTLSRRAWYLLAEALGYSLKTGSKGLPTYMSMYAPDVFNTSFLARSHKAFTSPSQ